MILVINLNASVDKRYKMKDLIKGEVMRAAEVDNTPGGKGIHVAYELHLMLFCTILFLIHKNTPIIIIFYHAWSALC